MYKDIIKKYILKYFKEDKNNLFGLIFFLILLNIIIFSVYRVVIWVNNVASSSPLLQLIVTGERFYTTDGDIQESVFLNGGFVGNFITQDVQRIQNRIKRYPWVKQVSVRKQWPDKIKIYILEYVPVAYWNHKYMLTKDAVLFLIPKRYMDEKSFPLLFGPEGSERDVLFGYCTFNEILQFSVLSIKSVSMDNRRSWKILLDNNIKLVLGRKNNIARLQRFVKIYPVFFKKYIKKNTEFVTCIDLRYESGFSVRKTPIVQYKR